MEGRKVTVVVSNDGKIAMSFNGFTGNSCYDEAEKIKSYLATFGISVDCENIIPHEETTEHNQTCGVKNELKH